MQRMISKNGIAQQGHPLLWSASTQGNEDTLQLGKCRPLTSEYSKMHMKTATKLRKLAHTDAKSLAQADD
eukprot:6308702-Amphidinium_carterae.1